MATDLKSVKIVSGALHESTLRGGTIVLRGVIDSSSLKTLMCDDYQREALPLASLSKLMAAVKEGVTLPDIEIGMRGQKYRTTDDNWYLQDDCYIIDGQQRVNACVQALAQQPSLDVFLGATIHFATTKPWERERFRILNANRIKVSPNILLRNMRDDHHMINVVYDITDGGSVLAGKVSWDQNMKRGKLITALNLLRVTARLHSHLSPGFASRIDDLANQLDNLAEKVTPSIVRDNVKTFFAMVDEVWGLRNVQYREMSLHLSGGFLSMLARLLSDHTDFWRNVNESRLFIDAPIKRKLSSFPIHDPGVAPLTSSAGASQNILYGLVVKHLNSGKRTKRLQARPGSFDEGIEAPEAAPVELESEEV